MLAWWLGPHVIGKTAFELLPFSQRMHPSSLAAPTVGTVRRLQVADRCTVVNLPQITPRASVTLLRGVEAGIVLRSGR